MKSNISFEKAGSESFELKVTSALKNLDQKVLNEK
jgi:hypothetical protein